MSSSSSKSSSNARPPQASTAASTMTGAGQQLTREDRHLLELMRKNGQRVIGALTIAAAQAYERGDTAGMDAFNALAADLRHAVPVWPSGEAIAPMARGASASGS